MSDSPNENLPPDEPATLAEWLWRLRHHESRIYVRRKGPDGRWGNAALSELPPREWAECVAGWLEGGHLPVRVREPGEMGEG